ncbi:hypothetical protein, partial [Escherichia coli]|uniref:hypothetical protein n=1 Tax=Escherichia coli TaxID=562 RepID=UPI001BFCE17C
TIASCLLSAALTRQVTVWHKFTKESGERARNLLRDREALAGCRGAAMTGLLSITPSRERG